MNEMLWFGSKICKFSSKFWLRIDLSEKNSKTLAGPFCFFIVDLQKYTQITMLVLSQNRS